MKLKSLLAASVAASALVAAAPAQSGSYISVFGGFGSIDPSGLDIDLGPYTFPSGTETSPVGTQSFSKFVDTLWVLDPSTHAPNSQTSSHKTSQFSNFYVTAHNRNTNTVRVHSAVSLATNEDNIDVGYVVGVAAGYSFDFNVRLELELSHRFNDLGGVRNLNGGANATIYRHITDYYTGTIKRYSITKLMTSYTTQKSYSFTYTYTGTGSSIKNTNITNTIGTKTYTHKTHTNLINSVSNFTINAARTLQQTESSIQVRTESSGHVSGYAVMANVWYDLEVRDSPIVPFFGVGVGLANLSVEYDRRIVTPTSTISYGSSTDDMVLAWQAGVGVGFSLGNGMRLTGQYRYFGAEDLTLPGGGIVGVQSHSGLIGLHIPFGN